MTSAVSTARALMRSTAVEGALHLPCEAAPVVGLVGEGLDRADRQQGFVRMGAEIGDAVLAGPAQAAHPAAVDQDRQHHAGHHQGNQAGQLKDW